MGERLRDVLAAHDDYGLLIGEPESGWRCLCGHGLGADDETFDLRHRAHVEAVVLAWLGERLGDAEAVEAVVRAIEAADVATEGPLFIAGERDQAIAALTAVRALVTETSNEGDE